MVDFENGSRNPMHAMLPLSARPWRMRELFLTPKGRCYLAPKSRMMTRTRTIGCDGGGRRNARPETPYAFLR